MLLNFNKPESSQSQRLKGEELPMGMDFDFYENGQEISLCLKVCVARNDSEFAGSKTPVLTVQAYAIARPESGKA